ncbi:YrzQ family protein [Priestia flexa]|uniref:YrzQ family protein n=1 Tax=Priestia flexa TaxID=86664 RepID=A0ABU4J7A3_9BACI|nr:MULTISPECIES: YrzQ family protein [Bacillaceae]MBY6085229.1 YrzQ family protein [Priestia flexa]MCA1200749.1 YrzQ family protein [Priestia flexa]MCG7311765.1 YrzQ family protein [Priestia flexa]MCM3064897.1 YrzQ family protein [Priestia flexa]MCP1190708.1 YrzQ family protein [Priestia flexa]
MNRIIPSVVAFGLGAYAFKMAGDREMFTKRNMKKMRKRVMKAMH